MSTNLASNTCADEEEDYIDMELTTTSSLSKNNIEFEFQMSLSCTDKLKQTITTSPADELFYKGKLLPLHLPPRQQMVEKLAALEVTDLPFDEDHYYFSMPLDSCNSMISPSPSESCRVSCELNFGDYNNLLDLSDELSRFIENQSMKSTWSKRIKMIKNPSFIGQKLKASTTFLKSLFNKSHCNNAGGDHSLSKGEAFLDKCLKISKKQPFDHITRTLYPKITTFIEDSNVHRRSFSHVIKRHSPNKYSSSSCSSSSSSSFSIKSNGRNELHFLRRKSSAQEIEASINAAIDHCKKSLQNFQAMNSIDDDDGKKARSF